MIHHLVGTLETIHDGWVVIEIGGLGFKVALSPRDLQHLPATGKEIKLFCHLHVKEDALDLYGFLDQETLSLFELLIDVSGVGPKSALSILSVAEVDQLRAAIAEERPDIITHASGIGKKTAQRIILDLKNKIDIATAEHLVAQMEGDADIVEALSGLGYTKTEARSAVQKVDKEITGVEERIKEALKILKG